MQNLGRRALNSDLLWTGLGAIAMLGACGMVAAGLLSLSPTYVVAGTLALLGCGVILVNPYWGVLLFLALLYVRPEQFFPQVAAMRLPLLLSCLTLFAWVIGVLQKRETFRWRPELAWMAGFSVAMILSAFQVPGENRLLDAVLDAVRLSFLFLLLAQLLNTEARAFRAIQVLVAVTVVLALFAIHGWATGTMVLHDRGMNRAIVNVGDFDDPNDLAAALVIAVPAALFPLLRSRSFSGKAWGFVTSGILIFAIYLCNSRGGLLALGVALGTVLVRNVGWVRAGMVGAVVFGLIFALGPAHLHNGNVKEDDSAMGRIAAWQAGLNMLERSPLVGVGYNEFEKRHPIPAHNSLVHGLGEGGLFTAMTWVGLNYWAVLTLLRVRRRVTVAPAEAGIGSPPPRAPAEPVLAGYATALLGGILASVTAQMFLSHTYRPVPMLPLALAAALGALARDRHPGELPDWVHYILVPVITALGIGAVYVAVTVLS